MIMVSNYTRCVIRYGTVCKTQTILNSNFENNRMGNTSDHQIQAMSKYWILSPWLLDIHLYHFWKLFFGGGRGMLSELSWQIQPYNCHEWKRVNCVILIERPFGLYIELQEDTPNPRLEGYDYNTLILSLTPPLKCNVNAMSLHLKSGTKYMSWKKH